MRAEPQYILQIADDHLILGQRIAEWCGHAPTLEEELALANLGLDLLGQARALYAYAGELLGKAEDELAFLRFEHQYRNLLLVEQPNGDFAQTIVRQLFFSAFMTRFWSALTASTDETLAGIAAQAAKESTYHLRHAAEWSIRLGDGTAESHRRMVVAIDDLFEFTGELFDPSPEAEAMAETGIGVDVRSFRVEWNETVGGILTRATLTMPDVHAFQRGGRRGQHTEHLGHLLPALQFMQRTYPGRQW